MLVLDERDYKLSLVDGLLQCSHPDKGIKILPWQAISQLVIGFGVELTSDVILKIAAQGISLHVCGRSPTQQASLVPLHAPANDIKLQQFQVFSEPVSKQKLARKLVSIRANSQQSTLAALNIPLPSGWAEVLQQIDGEKNLMLVEARISKLYWQQLGLLLAAHGFAGRQRRPPPDPVNALISLSATLEDGLYCNALLAQGLELGVGFFHATGYRRFSLICDLKEVTRADLEYWVAGLFLGNTLNGSHFMSTDEGCRLTRPGQQIFYKNWYKFVRDHKGKVARVARIAKWMIIREARDG